MKKVLLLLCLLAGFSITQAQDQYNDSRGLKAGFAVGYISEISSIGGSLDLIYELDNKWSIGNTNMFTVNELPNKERLKWFTSDLNARYKVYNELYLLAGGQVLFETLIEKTFIGGFVSGEQTITNSKFGGNIGAGYKYHLISNANIFVEIKYTRLGSESTPVISSGYMQARIGMVFDL
tara:strand:- start:50013 stop:50549 length:537 start_codon:yes stop_codon:yes gene_type:complete